MAQKVKQQTNTFERYIHLAVPLFIIVATLIVYNPSLNNSFVQGWDDMEYINHPQVQGFKIEEIFTDYHLGMYQPLSVASLAMNYSRAGGLAPRAYHATNLLLHIVNIILIWVFIVSLTRSRMMAAISGMLFALHPMNVEAVAWISARSTLLFTAFYIAGLLAYLRYVNSKKPLHFGLTLLFALLSLFSKSLAMSFPLALLLIDYMKERGWSKKIWIEKVPFLLFSIIFGIIAINAAGVYGHITELAYDYTIIDRFFILCHTYSFYLFKLIVPVQLSPIYAYPDVSAGSLPLLYYISALIPIGLIYFMIRFWNKQRTVVGGILLFTVSVAPVLPIFWSRVFVAADRYAYISYIGIFLVIAFLIERLLKKESFRKMYIKYAAIGLVLIYGVLLAYLSRQQSKYWLETITLLSRAVDLSETAPAKAASHFYRANAYQNLAELRYREGQLAQDEKTVRDAFFFYRYAVSDYDSTMKYNPGHMLAYTNRGIVYGTLAPHDNKYYDYAIADYEKAISIDPGYADNYYNLAWVYYLQQDRKKACELWEKADELGSAVAWQAIEQNCK